MREEVLRMERVTYVERGVAQLENFSMTVWSGEIMGLVPVNYYGLAALLTLLRQNLPLHYGYVYYRERQVNHWKNPSMRMNRISLIQNKSCLAEGLTVADNIFVLRPGFKQHVICPGMLQKQLEPFLEDIDMQQIRAGELIENLSAFERFVVELLKAVVAGHRLVVLEHISTFISDAELEKLHRILRHYARQGMSFLYITVHCEEAEQMCDRSALMMNGQITKIFRRGEKMTEAVVLDDVKCFASHVKRQLADRMQSAQPAETVLRVTGLTGGRLNPISFSVAAGECLVLQDLHNCMIQDLLEILSSGRAGHGQVLVEGSAYTKKLQRRLAIIQETPVSSMLFGNMSYLENLCFTLDHRMPYVWGSRRLQNSMRREYARLLGEDVFERRMEELTEKEEYDLIYTRILLQNPSAVFCVQPFKGADASLRAHIVELLERFLKKGIGVVILAVNLADSLALADRLIRVHGSGRLEEYDRQDFGRLPADTPWRHLYREQKDK